jgi:hypothetical protein
MYQVLDQWLLNQLAQGALGVDTPKSLLTRVKKATKLD